MRKYKLAFKILSLTRKWFCINKDMILETFPIEDWKFKKRKKFHKKITVNKCTDATPLFRWNVESLTRKWELLISARIQPLSSAADISKLSLNTLTSIQNISSHIFGLYFFLSSELYSLHTSAKDEWNKSLPPPSGRGLKTSLEGRSKRT